MTAASLAALRDIHLPPAPPLWPPAPGWWLLAGVVLLAGAAWLAWRALRRRPLRAALRELDQLAAAHARSGDAPHLARGISRLLRRYACWRYPQAGVPALTGRAWLQFLDDHGLPGQFGVGAGAVLESLPYRRQGDADTAALIQLARGWLCRNAP